MGGVFRVEDSTLEREVALKVINVDDPACSARLLQEARVIAKLEHPGIVPVHDAGTLPDGRPYYTMKLVQGKRLDELGNEAGGISDRLRMFLRICEPVAFAHAHGVLHRDLKPANIMIGPFGEVLVMDWGLSKLMAEGIASGDNSLARGSRGRSAAVDATAHGSVLGTPGYMAPEQRNGEKWISRRTFTLWVRSSNFFSRMRNRACRRGWQRSGAKRRLRIEAYGTLRSRTWRTTLPTSSTASLSALIRKVFFPVPGDG